MGIVGFVGLLTLSIAPLLSLDLKEDECLGELRKMHVFSVDDVRRIIQEYNNKD